ncbi:MAG: LamG domain-containing protein [Bacteriovoracaceae bacterium]
MICTGTKAEFEGSGIQATVTTNATTTIYAKAYDSLSNASTCTSMLSFVHDSTAPTVPTFSSTNPASPSSSSTTPTIIGSASADTVTLNIYSNAGCTTQVGTGSKATFEAAGISLTVSANSTTTLYAKAYDSLSNATACTSMTSYTHDNTIPSTVASLTDGTYYSSFTSSPSLSWTASSDSGAGILRYEVSLGSSAGATDIVSWTNVGVTTSYQFTGITPNLVNGNTYYANVRVIDNAANTSSVTSSDGWTVDTSAPSDITVTFTGCTTNYLGATWTTSTDSESGISKYEYALGTTNGGTDVISWTSNANSTSLSLASLSLTAGNTYYLSARAVNNASTTSSTNTQSAVCTNLTTGLTAFWDMDENSGDRIDSLGTNDLTDNNTVAATGGRVDNSAVFDSANSEYLSSITNSDLETGDIDFTLSFWVYLTDNSVSTPLINKWGGTTDEFSVEWVNSGDIRFKVGTGTVNYSTSLNNNTWYHIVAYHDATNNLIGISLNGGTATTAAHATGNSVGDSNFYIGRDSGGTTYFTGRIDAVGFWKKVLTSYERKVLYNSGSGRENPF